MRKFAKISFNQFKKDIINNKNIYDNYRLPSRSTKNSAGYDIYAIESFTLKPNEIKKIPTGIKVYMNNDEFLMLLVRSSMGFKYNIRMCNQVGIIDSDYCDNYSNEGHLWICLQNHGLNDYNVKEGEAIAQAIFTKFYTVSDEEEILNERTGGFGSTNKEG